MHRLEQIAAFLLLVLDQRSAAVDLRLICLDNLEDRVTRHEDPVPFDPFAYEVFRAAVRVGEEDGTAVIDDARRAKRKLYILQLDLSKAYDTLDQITKIF